jgi:hypothetical protein
MPHLNPLAPTYKLDSMLGLNSCNGTIHILWDYIFTEHEAACHVLSVMGITLGNHTGRLKETVGNFSNR